MKIVSKDVREKLFHINEKKYILGIIELCLGILWMHFSYIEWQLLTYSIILGISFFSGYRYESNMRQIVFSNRAKVYLSIYSIFASFFLVGNRGIVYPIESGFSIGRMVTLFVVVIWLYPIMINIYVLFKSVCICGAQKTNKCFFICLIIIELSLPSILCLTAFNPGIASYDTWDCMVNCVPNIVGMTNWHPPFYIIFLKAILTIWNSTYAVVIVQITMWTFVWIYGICFLREKVGIDDNFLFILAAIVGTMISNCMYVVSIWKDIPYSICLLWLTIILSQIAWDDSCLEKVNLYVRLVFAFIGVYFFRQNGIVPYWTTVIGLVCFGKKKKKVLLLIITSVMLICIIRYPIYSLLKVDSSAMGGKYIGLGQDMVGVYSVGGEMSEEALEIVHVLLEGEDASGYTPYYAYLSNSLDIGLKDFLVAYIDTFVKNPKTMINCIMCRNDAIWDIFPGEESFVNLVNFQGNADEIGDWSERYPKFKKTIVYKYFSSFAKESSCSQIGVALLWRSGIWVLCMLGCGLLLMYRKTYRKLVFILPWIGQIVGLILSTGWADFRYYWPLNIIGIYAIFFVKSCIGEKNNELLR